MRPAFCAKFVHVAAGTLVAAISIGAPTAVRAQATITVSPATVAPGGTITVTVTNPSPASNDWVGIYTTAAPDTMMLDWKYLNGTRVAPASPISPATVTFTAPTTLGTYNVRFFAKDSYVRLATSATITVQVNATATITATPLTVAPGGTVTATVTNGPANARDWIGMYATGAPDTLMLDWKYLNGTKTAPATGVATATVTFTMPTTAGTYNLRFFSNDTLTLLATSATITVQVAAPAPATLTVTPALVPANGTISVAVANGPGNARDWVALYQAGAANASFVAWKYLNGLQTPPATGMTSATVTFTNALASGAYNVRLFSNDTYTLVASSPNFTVDATPPAVSIAAPAPNASVSGTIAVSANASDNVAVAGVQFKLDGANLGAEVQTPPYTTSWDTSKTAAGAHTLLAVARDTAGNVTTSAAVTVTVVGVDVTPPVISAVMASGITVSSATITWTTNEASDSDVEYGLTAAYGTLATLDPTLVTAHRLTISGLSANTLYHYRVRSRDAAANLALSGDFTFTTAAADVTPPTVSITAPANAAAVTGIVTISAAASDNVAVVGVQFLVDGSPVGAEVMAAPYSVAWDTTVAPVGAHTLTAVARDGANNRTTSAPVTVTVMATGQVTIAWDPNVEATLAGYDVYVGVHSGVYTMKIDATKVTTFTVTGLTPGQQYYFAVTAYDVNHVESGYSNEVTTVVPNP